MRTHATILREAGKAEDCAAKRGISIHTFRSWIQRDSIPSEHWQGCVDDGWTTLEELAAAAARKVTA